ncbi:MAG: iron-containing alcohol dehydrogenase [Planctomycetaceae bacterium]
MSAPLQTASPPSGDPLPAGLAPFDFRPRTRVVFGPGVFAQLGTLARELGGTRVLLVSDPGLRSVGHVDRAVQLLREARLEVACFDEVQENPTTVDVDRAVTVARAARSDLLIGLGGGSSLDCAKGASFLLSNAGRMEDYWGYAKATRPLLPLLAVPTTAGTGSEAQSYAIIAQAESHVKMACGDPGAAPRIALLDPELTLTLPRSVTAITGIDAISHAVESFVSTRRNPLSSLFAEQAARLLVNAFPQVLAQPHDPVARGQMLWGAHLAGMAIENSMLGAAHACANPLSALCGLTHGIAVGVMLPHVVRYNQEVAPALYAPLLTSLGFDRTHEADAGATLARLLTTLLEAGQLPTRLGSCGVPSERIPQLAAQATHQWTGKFNPRPVTQADFQLLYERAL